MAVVTRKKFELKVGNTMTLFLVLDQPSDHVILQYSKLGCVGEDDQVLLQNQQTGVERWYPTQWIWHCLIKRRPPRRYFASAY